jgi:hypothetical protein
VCGRVASTLPTTGAREVTERLIRDAGYEPMSVGGLENARALEEFVPSLLSSAGSSTGSLRPASCSDKRPPLVGTMP